MPVNFEIGRAFSLDPLMEPHPLLRRFIKDLERELSLYMGDIYQEIERRLIPARTVLATTVDQSIPVTASTLVQWDSVIVDDYSAADLTAEAIVIPRGVRYVAWLASLRVTTLAAGRWRGDIYLNAATSAGYGDSTVANFDGNDRLLMVGRIVEVVPGDSVTVMINQTDTVARNILSGSYFEVLYLRG